MVDCSNECAGMLAIPPADLECDYIRTLAREAVEGIEPPRPKLQPRPPPSATQPYADDPICRNLQRPDRGMLYVGSNARD